MSADPALIWAYLTQGPLLWLTATLAAYISDTGLGRYLFAGLKSRDYPQMLAGALLVAALALVLDLALGALQRASRGHTRATGSLASEPTGAAPSKG